MTTDIKELRERLETSQGPEFWKSLEEAAETPEFREALEREFSVDASRWDDSVSRRHVLKLLGASLSLAGLNACGRQPLEQILPYAKAPEEIIPGRPLFYATAMSSAEGAIGLLVKTHMGRPVKIEGNPSHPESLGSTDIFAQASLLDLYDPDRSQVIRQGDKISTWDNFLAAAAPLVEAIKAEKGKGLAIVSDPVHSPTLLDQRRQMRIDLPEAQWIEFDPLAGNASYRADYNLENADVILTLDANILAEGSGSVRYAKAFAARRGASSMNRLYSVETMPTPTGTLADHRLALAPGAIAGFAADLARKVGVAVAGDTPAPKTAHTWASIVAKDLAANRGRCLVVAGAHQSAQVHALADAMNVALGNVGQTVTYAVMPPRQTLADLRGDVSMLIILGGNPAYSAANDLNFAKRISAIPFVARLGLHEDETSAVSRWHIPEAHYLESWSDAVSSNGTASIVQPMIAPLYGGRTAHEVLDALFGKSRSSYSIVRDYWTTEKPVGFEKLWRKFLHDGVVEGWVLSAAAAVPSTSVAVAPEKNGVQIVFRPDPTVGDGRYANNGWLQELPKPLTKITWDNAAIMSPAMAESIGVKNEDLVELSYRGKKVNAPAWILPGHAEESVTVHLGYGRTHVGRVGAGNGFNAYLLRTSDAPWQGPGLVVTKAAGTYPLAVTQDHHSLLDTTSTMRQASKIAEKRHLVRVGKPEEFAHPQEDALPSFYPEHKYEGHAWGMSIDLNVCSGCNACVAACQAENNIPVVGKTEVMRGREMHWMRIDRYFQGGLDAPEIHHQPMLCQHCETAPCEPVCPVGATTHSSEGINEQTYNRCVGTKYCSNNCPYKVRRFNFFQYTDETTESFKLMRNPDVTLRNRGVMEKCTYCVQRINSTRITAKKEDRDIVDGEIVTACQAVCPTNAIVFGDINNPMSKVTKSKSEHRNYGVLTELGTQPRTTYLAKLKNPNPELAG